MFTMTTHNFKDSMSSAKEDVIDAFLKEQGFVMTEATREDQRKGIDRFCDNGQTLEYKTEWRVTDTGNFFLETISVDISNKPGWIEYSEATDIVYYLPKENQIWFVKLEDLKANLERWKEKYPLKSARNRAYSSWGVVVPRAEIEKFIYKRYVVS